MKLQITSCINCPFTYEVSAITMGCKIGYKDDTKRTFRPFSDLGQEAFKTSWCPFYEEDSIIIELHPIVIAEIKEEKEPEKTLWDHLNHSN